MHDLLDGNVADYETQLCELDRVALGTNLIINTCRVLHCITCNIIANLHSLRHIFGGGIDLSIQCMWNRKKASSESLDDFATEDIWVLREKINGIYTLLCKLKPGLNLR
jgi:hypothetical protein